VYDIFMNAQVHRGILLQMLQSRSDSVGASRSECANVAKEGVGDIARERSMEHPLNEPWWGHVARNLRSPLHARHASAF
jgi:hypothetical protein